MPSFLIFIPCYRCEEQVKRVIRKLSASGINADVLLTDNRSPDNTIGVAKEELAASTIKNATIVLNHQNYSLGGSHKVAFTYALSRDYSHVVVLHGDDQADINDLTALLKEKQYLRYDCLLGSRFLPGSQLKGYSRFRILGNKVLNRFCELVCRAPVTDMGSGLNMYSRSFLEDKRYMTFPDDLTFNISLLFHSHLSGYKIKSFPITWREEDQVSNAKVFRQMWKILRTIIRTLNDRSYLYQGTPGQYSFEVVYQK